MKEGVRGIGYDGGAVSLLVAKPLASNEEFLSRISINGPRRGEHKLC